jgi:hypothetical protein
MNNLICIGDRILNLDEITHVSYDSSATHPAISEHYTELVVSFGCDDFQTFYNSEADALWKALKGRAFVLQTLHPTEVVMQ